MIIVVKQAVPPIQFEIGSAKNTPVVPSPAMAGRHNVSGITMIALRSREKKIACFDLPRATKADCPENCKAIMKIPKKYRWRAGIPSFNKDDSLLNRRMIKCGKKKINAHVMNVNTMENAAVSFMADFTRSYFLAP